MANADKLAHAPVRKTNRSQCINCVCVNFSTNVAKITFVSQREEKRKCSRHEDS